MAAVPETPRIGSYRLLHRIATGGMGEVFLAAPDVSGPAKPVVVKRILRHLASDAAFVRLFLNEARIAAVLAHPNIVQVLDLGEDGGVCFMAMEHVHGRSLRDVARKAASKGQAVPLPLIAGMCGQALAGLHYAHQFREERRGILGVIHRDVSPENMLVGFDGYVKVGDFGIAKALKSGDPTRTVLLKGKLSYMSPEHLQGKKVDARTDIYSMGVVLYELLTGRRPFHEATDALLVHRVLSGARPRPLRELRPDVSDVLEASVSKALSLRPEDRFATAEEMGRALGPQSAPAEIGAYLAGLYGSEANLTPGEPLVVPPATAPVADTTDVSNASRRRAGRRRWVGAAALTTGVALGAAAGVHQLLRRPAAMPPPREAPLIRPPTPTPPVATPKVERAPAPAPAPKPAPPTAAPKAGKVRFLVYPWAEVFYRGKSLGITPMAPVDAAAGTQTYLLKNRDLGQQREVRVQVPAGGVAVLKYDFQKR